MIASSVYANDDLKKYPDSIQKAIKFIKSHNFLEMDEGEYPIDGDRIYAKVFDLTSRPVDEVHPEVHRNYIDVQFWVNGRERIGYAPLKADYHILEEHTEQDLYFLDKIEDETLIGAVQGDYMIFFPNDIHRPGVADGEPLRYRKVVVKVHIDTL